MPFQLLNLSSTRLVRGLTVCFAVLLTPLPLALQDAIAATLAPGDILLADAGAREILQIDPVTGAITIISSGGSLLEPIDVKLDGGGDLVVSDFNANAIFRIDPSTGNQTAISSGGSFVNPYGFVFDENGDILLVDRDAFGGSGGVIRVDPITGVQTTVSSGGSFGDPRGIVLDENGDILVADSGTSSGPGLVKVDPATGAQSIISFGDLFVLPVGIDLDANGDIYVTDTKAFGGTGGVIRVDPSSGAQTAVSSGGFFDRPVGIDFEASGDIVVSDANVSGDAGDIVRVDPSTGAQTLINNGNTFGRPRFLSLVPQVQTPIDSPAEMSLTGGPLKEDGFGGLEAFLDVNDDGQPDEGPFVAVDEGFAQHYGLDLTITRTGAAATLGSFLVLDEVPTAYFELDGAGEDFASDGLIDEICLDGSCDGINASLECPVTVTGPDEDKDLSSEIIVIEPDGLGDGDSCTTSIYIATTHKSGKGKGPKVKYQPTRCVTVFSDSGLPITNSFTMNPGVKTFDDAGNLRAGPVNSIQLELFGCP